MKPPSRAKTAVLWTCTALALGLLLVSYAIALTRDTWPKGHPWHGIALAAMAGFFAVQTRLHRGGTAMRAIAVLLPLLAMGAMAMAMAQRGS